jgi:hypothetical protein
MKRMLIQNPDERISASDALRHPYFINNGVNNDKVSTPVTMGSYTRLGWDGP